MAVGRPLRGNRWQELENRLMTMRTQVLPSEADRSMMKSTPRYDQDRLGTCSGRSLPDGKRRRVLETAQSEQLCMNLLTSLVILGHQKRSFSNERVPLAPGWPVPRDVCTEWISGVRRALVMYCKPGGQLGGVGVETLEGVSDSGFHWMGLTIISFGMTFLVPHRPLLGNGDGREHPLLRSWDLDDMRLWSWKGWKPESTWPVED